MKKFIIVKRKDERFVLRYANVELHSQMVHGTDEVFGGGMFDFNEDDTIMTLYGKSEDYGVPKWLDIRKTKEKIHIDEELKGMTIRWLSGYDDDWNPIYLDFTDMFEFDYF